MSEFSRTAPAVLVIATSPVDAAQLRASTADAIVVSGIDIGEVDALVTTIAAVRPDIPLLILTDIDHRGALALVAQGADDVLDAGASTDDVDDAVRVAVIRRRRRARGRDGLGYVATTFPDAPHLEAVARLSAGIAHEFNNLLTVVMVNIERIERGLPRDLLLHDAAASIAGAAEQAALLTRQLLAFGRQQTLVPAVIDLGDLVEALIPDLARVTGSRVEVVPRPAGGPIPVRIDRESFGELIVSLAAMARDAMPGGGTLRIGADTHLVSDVERRVRVWLPSGRFARLQVADTGLGFEEHALPHLFEPFFAAGARTPGGLTMASVYGVVKQSDGFIWVDSRAAAGTTVTILLPLLAGLAAPENRVEAVMEADAPAAGETVVGTAIRVLLVEDTDAVRVTLTSLLMARGFLVSAAATAEEALELVRAGPVDLLLTDVVLPGANGPALAAAFRALWPGTPVMFMSGYNSALAPQDLDTPRAFIQKPFSIQTLIERIHEVLASQRSRDEPARRAETDGFGDPDG